MAKTCGGTSSLFFPWYLFKISSVYIPRSARCFQNQGRWVDMLDLAYLWRGWLRLRLLQYTYKSPHWSTVFEGYRWCSRYWSWSTRSYRPPRLASSWSLLSNRPVWMWAILPSFGQRVAHTFATFPCPPAFFAAGVTFFPAFLEGAYSNGLNCRIFWMNIDALYHREICWVRLTMKYRTRPQA